MRLPVWVRLTLAALVAAGAGLIVLDRLFPPPIEIARSVIVTDSGGQALRAFPVEDGRWRLPVETSRVDPAFIETLIAMEDQRFYAHTGVDPLAVIRAATTSLASGRIVSGASTLTMQTARLLEPRPRNLGSKIIEAWRALQLEARLSKDEILELYLTLAPYGGNIEGVRAASWAWFGREPDRLTPDQIALLVALPQSPEVRRPDLRPDHAHLSRRRVLDRMASAGLIAPDRAVEAADAPIPERSAFPALAWHAADEAVRRADGEAEIRTTLDYSLQTELEAYVRERAAEAGEDVQIAVLVVETDTRAVRAAIGSASRQRGGGWIDLTDRPRSPGSTLKPFIYGLAFDDGVATPDTVIADAPRRFASYRPENFDRAFNGDVTIAAALQHSLNVPAVYALDSVGARRFASALRFAGAEARVPVGGEDEAGLAIALGGVGLTVREVATLYAALGDGGEARPLRWLESAPLAEAPDGRIMSAQSAGDILQVLRDAPHPGGRMPASLTRGAPQIAFKTGTSYGFRDAWAAGVSGGLTVVVWVGRADGQPRPGETGRSAALPLLFDIFDRAAPIDPRRRRAWGTDDTPRTGAAPAPLVRFNPGAQPPDILFPPDAGEIWSEGPDRDFVLSARAETSVRWFADGVALSRNGAGDTVWAPRAPGFYTLTAVDREGRTSHATVRVRMPPA
ncbi:penicillin-binding protein 1C [Hyphobacterium sp. Y6023]|uniref:peptidoglycan glycosyltransferase n=2 Tax=Hyphobacterium marinum TaxID=3116574 RepID=A0ABU7LVW9_9PROT|nr:penicillin-binding protein 1C [Hyphobacterium sp. Y6023]